METRKKVVIMIPGFGEYPETQTFKDLRLELERLDYSVNIIAWPHYPDNLEKYSFTETLHVARKSIKEILNSGKEIFLHGHSMGGILAILLAKEFKPSKLSLTVTPYQAGTEDDLDTKYKDWKATGFREFTSSKYGKLIIPFSFIQDAKQYNALDYIPDVKCPILFITGEEDKNVPWKTTRKLYDKANQPKEWHLIPNMEHKFQYQPEILVDVNKTILDFIRN